MRSGVEVQRLLSRCVLPAVVVAVCHGGGLADPASVPPDAGVDQLAEAFSPCDGFDDVSNASGALLATVAWIEVTGLVELPEGEGSQGASGVVEGSENGTGSVTSRRVHAHWTYWPGIEWTVVNGGELWLGLGTLGAPAGEDVVSVVVAFTPAGSAFFPGECQEAIVGDPLRRFYGDDFDAILQQAVGTTGDELRQVLAAADRAGI
jgi:hypothetical protein